MRLEDITFVGAKLDPISHEAVTEAEASLHVTFPHGYREYITRFGEGVLGGYYIRVYPPRRIVNEYREFQERWDTYWFWDDGCDILPKQQALECIIIADTLDGDEVIFHPSNPKRLLLLPRNSEMIYELGPDLFIAIDWLCTSGILTEAFIEREFEPFDSETD